MRGGLGLGLGLKTSAKGHDVSKESIPVRDRIRARVRGTHGIRVEDLPMVVVGVGTRHEGLGWIEVGDGVGVRG